MEVSPHQNDKLDDRSTDENAYFTASENLNLNTSIPNLGGLRSALRSTKKRNVSTPRTPRGCVRFVHCGPSRSMGVKDLSRVARLGCGLDDSDIYCLFGTVHIKAACALLTIIYLVLLLLLDIWFVTNLQPSDSYYFACSLCGASLAVIFLTQYGIMKENPLFCVPLVLVQIIFGLIAIAFGVSLVAYEACSCRDACCFIRILMIFGAALCIFGLHVYCLTIAYDCWRYFNVMRKKRTLHDAFCENDDGGDDVVIFEKQFFAKK